MKILLLLFISINVKAETFHLLYNTQGFIKDLPVFTMKVNAKSFEDALDKNAVKCFDSIVTKEMGPRQKIEIIDVCVNPRLANE